MTTTKTACLRRSENQHWTAVHGVVFYWIYLRHFGDGGKRKQHTNVDDVLFTAWRCVLLKCIRIVYAFERNTKKVLTQYRLETPYLNVSWNRIWLYRHESR